MYHRQRRLLHIPHALALDHWHKNFLTRVIAKRQLEIDSGKGSVVLHHVGTTDLHRLDALVQTVLFAGKRRSVLLEQSTIRLRYRFREVCAVDESLDVAMLEVAVVLGSSFPGYLPS